MTTLDNSDYARLLEVRISLRRFLRWSEEEARAAGLTPAQHQLMLAIRGHDDPLGPTIGEAADSLLVRHHSAVGLVDRAVEAGLVTRHPDPENHRAVRLRLTDAGAAKLRDLSSRHIEELRHLTPTMEELSRALALRAPSAAGRGA